MVVHRASTSNKKEKKHQGVQLTLCRSYYAAAEPATTTIAAAAVCWMVGGQVQVRTTGKGECR